MRKDHFMRPQEGGRDFLGWEVQLKGQVECCLWGEKEQQTVQEKERTESFSQVLRNPQDSGRVSP